MIVDMGVVEAAGLSLAGLKRRVDREAVTDDDLLADYLAAAFEQAQAPPPHGCGRLLVADPADDSDSPVTRRILSRNRRVQVPDAREITEVLVDGDATTSYETIVREDMIVQLSFADDGLWVQRGECGITRVERVVQVTGRFGFTSLPISLADAIYILAARDYYERAAQYADQIAILEGSAVQSYYRQLPPRTKLAFARFSLPAGLSGLA